MTDVPALLARLAPTSPVDFAAFGAVEEVKLSRIQTLAAGFLGRNWVTIPHVTHHDDVDVTHCEALRADWNARHPEMKLTILSPLIKAMVGCLREFPRFNASLKEGGDTLILKKYFNIGVAVESPMGLLVPVVTGCDTKTLPEIASNVAALAAKARGKGLSMAEMSGSSMSVSSLGHIGGTGFTPIINAPDVAILGVTAAREVACKAKDGGVTWRKMLPVSLSYDHRVINGADAARFVRHLGKELDSPTLFG